MEMTIDEAIEYNKNLKMYMEISDRQDTYKFLEENHVALDIAIAIMGKYQKIERILNWREYDVDPNYHTNEDMINEIREVMKDGNVD